MHPLLWISLLALTGARAEERSVEVPSIRIELSDSHAHVGQPLGGQVIVGPCEKLARPEFETSDDFEVEFLEGPVAQPVTAHDSSEATTKTEQVFRYRFLARRPGTLLLPAAKADWKGTVLRSPPQVVDVLTATPQDLAFLRIHSDRSRVYPTQQFTVSLTVSIQELPQPFQDQDPLSVFGEGVVRPPHLQIPWVDRQQIPQGLAPLTAWETWLEPLRSTDPSGLRINQVGERSVRAVLENRAVTFHPPAHKVVRPDRNGIERRFWQYEFSRRFVASKVGQYTFGPSVLEGGLAASVDAEKTLVFETVTATAEPISVVVQPLPEEGKPADFIGIIGQFELEAQLTPSQAKVGDPLFLELRVHGPGSLTEAFPPDLSRLPEVATQFRVYDARQATSAEEVRFTYRVRPLQPGIVAFPPLRISYFDVEQEEYVPLESPAIPLEILPAPQLSANQIVMASEVSVAGARGELFANISEASALRDDALRLLPWGTALAGLTFSYLVAAVVATRLRRRCQDSVTARRRAAPALARSRLRLAQAEWQAGRTDAAATLVHTAIVDFLRDSLMLSAAGLTVQDLEHRLAEACVDRAVIEEITRLLKACDAARFGRAPYSFAGWDGRWQGTLDRLMRALKHSRRSA